MPKQLQLQSISKVLEKEYLGQLYSREVQSASGIRVNLKSFLGFDILTYRSKHIYWCDFACLPDTPGLGQEGGP